MMRHVFIATGSIRNQRKMSYGCDVQHVKNGTIVTGLDSIKPPNSLFVTCLINQFLYSHEGNISLYVMLYYVSLFTPLQPMRIPELHQTPELPPWGPKQYHLQTSRFFSQKIIFGNYKENYIYKPAQRSHKKCF